MRVLVTGAAGFIGWRTSQELLKRGYTVVGTDNLNDYYSPTLKFARLKTLQEHPRFSFHKADVEEMDAMEELFKRMRPEAVVHLAARAGVRASMEDPFIYMSTNAMGTLNLLELCRRHGVKRFVLASTSSLYAGQPMPFREDMPVNEPISPYAASKKAAEAISYTYHYLYGMDVFVLRYFTVYGPMGRPDMSCYIFTRNIMAGEPITVYGDGTQKRDFTYVQDIAEGTVLALEACRGFEVINLGNNNPHELNEVISIIEELVGKRAKINHMPFHKADMKATWAEIEKAKRILGWSPKVSLREGLEATVRWFKDNWEIANIKWG